MMEKQMKDLAWNTFKQTGNINTFMELKQLQNLQNEKIFKQQEAKEVELPIYKIED